MREPRSIGEMAQWACVAEVTAPKAGNVHPRRSFADVSWQDFVVSAMVTRPLLDAAPRRGVGPTVLDCVMATKAATGTNTNLGMLLLLGPLCAVPLGEPLEAGLARVLGGIGAADTMAVYMAIRHAAPGGLGCDADADVCAAPHIPLVDAMKRAAAHDAVARQYASGFRDVIAIGHGAFNGAEPLDHAIVAAHLRQMAGEPDSLIRRKCGDALATEAQQRAAAALAAGWPATARGRQSFRALDTWLRADGNRRNPGTSADLVATGLFVALRENRVSAPFSWRASLPDPE